MAATGKAALTAVLLAGFAAGPAAAETRSFVVDWFWNADFYDAGTCPDGLNISSAEFYRRDLLRLGMPRDKVEEVMRHFPGEGGEGQPWIPLVRVRGNGKDNVYARPETAPDPQLKLATGRFAYGFDLDGKAGPGSFEEPDTHEAGVDNALFRAFGCLRAFVGPGRPSLSEVRWDILRNQMPAWLVTLDLPDGGRDGDATVILQRAVQTITRDASGNAQADMTYELDPNPRAHSVLRGRVQDGVITADAAEARIVGDAYLAAELDFKSPRLRLSLGKDGRLAGMIGGYLAWYDIYWGFAHESYVTEYAASVDIPGIYYALKKTADADPEPETGQNTRISAAFKLEAVPAYVTPVKTAAR
jgi:hypothetical protein